MTTYWGATRLMAMTESFSANANLLFHISIKFHMQHNLFDSLEEEREMLKYMEDCDGLAA